MRRRLGTRRLVQVEQHDNAGRERSCKMDALNRKGGHRERGRKSMRILVVLCLAALGSGVACGRKPPSGPTPGAEPPAVAAPAASTPAPGLVRDSLEIQG